MALGADDAAQRFEQRRKRKERHQSQLPGQDEEQLPPPVETIRGQASPKRNDPCTCGSGKKYKQCCGKT